MNSPRKPRHAVASSRPLPTEVLHYKDGYEAQNGTVVQFQSEWTKQHQLEGDGLLPLLYDHLWKSDKTREHRLRDAMIPDTVVFEHNFPRAWYTYDLKAQEIVKRAGKLLDSHSIYKFFGTEEKGCDIVAQFYYKSTTVPVTQLTPRPPSGRARSPGSNQRTNKEAEEELTTSVEFFTKEQLFNFIHTVKVKPDGVLQKFLVSKGESSARRSSQIQAVWSPLVTLIYKRTNKHRINDKVIPVADRAATFDGPPHCSEESIVADSTKTRITDLCEKIVHHFFVTEHKSITRIILYFKMDDQDRIWVLWASSLRIGGDRLNPSYLRVPLQLGMRVENSNAGTSRGEVESRRKTVESQLLDKDIALYDLTGDWTFAAQCVSSHQHHNTNNNRSGNTSPTGKSHEDLHQTTSPMKIEQRRESTGVGSTAADAVSADAATTTGESPRHRRSTAHHDAIYISSRAPFLPTIDRQEKITVDSPRHPLHQVYAEAHAGDAHNSTDGNASSGSNSSRKYFARRLLEDATAKASRSTRLVKSSELELCREDLCVCAHDLVYKTYCRVIDQSTNAEAETGAVLEIPDVLQGTLTHDQIASLAGTLGATWDADEGTLIELPAKTIGRGRRRDRPAAQVYDDVRQFFANLFASEGPAVLQRYREYFVLKEQERSRALREATYHNDHHDVGDEA